MYLFFLSHDNKFFKTKIKLFFFTFVATLQKKNFLNEKYYIKL
jgi:hypothetical protein